MQQSLGTPCNRRPLLVVLLTFSGRGPAEYGIESSPERPGKTKLGCKLSCKQKKRCGLPPSPILHLILTWVFSWVTDLNFSHSNRHSRLRIALRVQSTFTMPMRAWPVARSIFDAPLVREANVRTTSWIKSTLDLITLNQGNIVCFN